MTPSHADAPRQGISLPIILIALTAIGPLGIDMYLPVIPDMAKALDTTEGAVQLSLMTFFIGLMLGQLAYGPLSDKFGRKPLIYLGLGIFTLGSIGCALADNIVAFQWLRFVQGIGASIGMVIAFAIAKDLFKGQALGSMMSLILAALGLCPILAPMLGNLVAQLDSWRAIFWTLMMYGLILGAGAAILLPETRGHAERKATLVGQTLQNYKKILINRAFLPYALALCIAQAGFFTYIAGSASVFISQFNFSPTQFSLLFALNALGLVAASISNPKLHARFGPVATYRFANTTYFGLMALLLLYLAAGGTNVIILSTGLFFALAMMGFIMPTGSTLALMEQRQLAGTASALLGAMQFGAGAVMTALSGALAGLGATGMVLLMTTSSVVSALICWTLFPKRLR
ncbi:multidrug effflux MFS transporter [Pusillimonas sp. NJUB218]|uniref:multidrug effflux MFS transporter n=1 Tax=Pusillimonas sp. NJUB218 TaxID=2023230 RepID=UPI000F4AFB36|nr:multidrug effflux MFS transporter [Pusillimonas sp. NJUB218]ROT46501.1 Bcr/CflA family drug resistance efflux transporter [Pusillimonas sp. NJUB218]